MSLLRSRIFRAFRNRVLSGATRQAVRALYLTVRFRDEGWQRAQLEAWHGGGAIFAFWHNGLMLPLGHESRLGAHALISPGRDGEFAARVVGGFGVRAIRATASGSGRGALLAAVRSARDRCYAVTPDGPRGPRYTFRRGVAWLASRTGLPVVPLGMAVSRAWRLHTWDRYRIPKPFSTVHLVFGPPLRVRRGLGRPELEEERRRLEDALRACSREASRRVGCAWPD